MRGRFGSRSATVSGAARRTRGFGSRWPALPSAIVFLCAASLFCAGLSLTACADGSGDAPASDAPTRFLSIEGDVERNILFNTGTPVKNDEAMPGDADFEGVPLTDFVAEAGISGTPKTIFLLSSGDGFATAVDYDGAGTIYIAFSGTKGWRSIAPDHPPGANAMDIDRVIIVSEDSAVGLRVTRPDGTEEILSMGNLLTAPQRAEFHLDGTSSVKGADGDRSASLYTRRYSIALSDVSARYAGLSFVVETAGGETYLTDGGGRFTLYRQTIDYVEATGDVYEDVIGIQLR